MTLLFSKALASRSGTMERSTLWLVATPSRPSTTSLAVMPVSVADENSTSSSSTISAEMDVPLEKTISQSSTPSLAHSFRTAFLKASHLPDADKRLTDICRNGSG